MNSASRPDRYSTYLRDQVDTKWRKQCQVVLYWEISEDATVLPSITRWRSAKCIGGWHKVRNAQSKAYRYQVLRSTCAVPHIVNECVWFSIVRNEPQSSHGVIYDFPISLICRHHAFSRVHHRWYSASSHVSPVLTRGSFFGHYLPHYISGRLWYFVY